jgi:hypothetical protein
MPTPQERFESIVEQLAEEAPDVSAGKMFGMPIIKVAGKAIGGPRDEGFVFKLDEAARAKALKLEGAHPFDPMGGRPMKEWVVVPEQHVKRWLGFAQDALAYRNS